MQDEILKEYEVRKTNHEKSIFISYIKERLSKAGYKEGIDICVEEKYGNKNVIIGNPEKAKVILSAHYDTCVRLGIPNVLAPTSFFVRWGYLFLLITVVILIAFIPIKFLGDNILLSLMGVGLLCIVLFYAMLGPGNKHNSNDNTSGVITITKIMERLSTVQREHVCAIYFDNEEKGCIGSKRFKKEHKKVAKDTMFVNFDCVGDGKCIVVSSSKKARKDIKYFTMLLEFYKFSEMGKIEFWGDTESAKRMKSDHRRFEKGIDVCVIDKRWFGLAYTGKIHTKKDIICDEKNVEVLSDIMMKFIEKI